MLHLPSNSVYLAGLFSSLEAGALDSRAETRICEGSPHERSASTRFVLKVQPLQSKLNYP